MRKLHPIQKALLEVGEKNNLRGLTLMQIALKIKAISGINVSHPQIVKHHLNQLISKGLIEFDSKSDTLQTKMLNKQSMSRLISIPIVGSANCGVATVLAAESIEGYLKISSTFIKYKDSLFAVKAVGNSMNAANIKGVSIDDGDYVIIDPTDKNINDGEYVLSIIDGLANIKKIKINNNLIVLYSQSKDNYPPIYIHQSDIEADSYLVNGKVVSVIKQVREDN